MILPRLMITLLMWTTASWGAPVSTLSPNDLLEKYAENIYYPTDYKLRDLYFEVKKDGLADQLTQAQNYGNIRDVIFKVYWWINLEEKTSKVEIVISGLPEGFVELKESLLVMISGQLGFVVPKKFGENLLQYKLSYYPDSYSIIQGVDESGKLAMNKFIARFDKNLLKSITAFVPVGTQDTEYNLSRHSWSHGKYVTNSIEIKSVEGTQTMNFYTKIKYLVVDGLGFPDTISLLTRSSLHTVKQSPGAERTFQREEIFRFSNYQINRNKAAEYFAQKSINDGPKR